MMGTEEKKAAPKVGRFKMAQETAPDAPAAKPKAPKKIASIPTKPGRRKKGEGSAREGKVPITGFFPPVWRESLKEISAKEKITMQQILEDAIGRYLKDHKYHP